MKANGPSVPIRPFSVTELPACTGRWLRRLLLFLLYYLFQRPGLTVKNGKVEVRLLPDRKQTLYLVELPLTRLYPCIPRAEQKLRFSRIVNESDGRNYTGIANWARGIFNARDPVEYGDLKPVK